MSELKSERVVVAAPMSLTGSAQRAFKLTHGKTGAGKVAMVVVALLLLAVWWPAIVVWYCVFGILLIPYRILRRGSRKRKRQALQHREMLAAVDAKKAP